MNRGVFRKQICPCATDYAMFLQLLEDSHRLWGAEVLAYCLMGKHYHLCLRTPGGNLARVVRHVNGLYTQYVNRTQVRNGPLLLVGFASPVYPADLVVIHII
jgi:hypothetical protein